MIAQFWLFHVKAELISDKNIYNLLHFRNGLRVQSQLQNARFLGGGSRYNRFTHMYTKCYFTQKLWMIAQFWLLHVKAE